jgi:hypothetical protein
VSPRTGARRRSPAKAAARRKPAKKAAKKRTAPKRAVKRAAPKRAKAKTRAPKRAAARRKVAKRSAPKRARAKRATPKRAARPKRTVRPKLAIVKRPTPRAAVAKPKHKPFGKALEGASAKDLVLFDLVRARVEVQAATQGMVAGSAETPIAEGKWNPRQIVLHLYYWDREMLPWIETAYSQGRRPPHTMKDILDENDSSQIDLGAHDWDEARRLAQHAREAIVEALQSLPEEPAEIWSSEHALGWLIRILAHHDRHHAAAIKNARIGAPTGV